MDIIIPVVFGLAVGFGVGVGFHKYVISEAESIKQHVTAEIAKLRGDASAVASKIASKV